MKNVNIFSIKAKFPLLKQNKKPYLIGRNKHLVSNFSHLSKSSKYNSNSISKKPFNHQSQSIRLMKSTPPLIFLEKNKFVIPSSSNFYVTGIQYNPSENININPYIKKSTSMPEFKTQINNKTGRYKIKNKKNLKNIEKDEESPRLRYLGSLIKFKKNKKNLKKSEKKEFIPQEKRQEYIDFINKKRQIFFDPKATSQYVHEKSSDYLINSIQRTKSYRILQPNYIIKPRNPKEEMIEMRDTVPNLPFNTQKLITQIRNLFSQDYKFNYSQFNETFYNNFENKINFINDIYRVPIFKNNLVKIILNKKEPYEFEEWKNINVINSTMWNYLNRLKTKIQREKDEKLKKEKELELKKKEEEENFLKKKKKKKRVKTVETENNKDSNSSIDESDNNKKIIKEEENYSNIMMNVEKEEKLKQQQYEDLYIIEEYFLHKNNYDNDRVSIASDRLRYIFFHKNENLLNIKHLFDY